MRQILLHFFTLMFFFLAFTFGHTQQMAGNYLVRSTTALSGASDTVFLKKDMYVLQQSIGQAGVIGTSYNAPFAFRQGFIQPNVLAKIINEKVPLNLRASVYPNPFTENVTISFSEEITSNIEVSLFDMYGRLVSKRQYRSGPTISVAFRKLSVAVYILKIMANNKSFVRQIIKK